MYRTLIFVTLIYVNENIPVERCEHLNDLPFKESSWCELRINGKEKILIKGLYKSPNSGIKNHANLFNILNDDYIKVHKNIVMI